jgi:hypothetical protein
MQRWAELSKHASFQSLRDLPLSQAREQVASFLAGVAEDLPDDVHRMLPGIQDVAAFQSSRALVDHLDTLYFDLEDAGRLTESGLAFSAARFAAACLRLAGATTYEDLMEAAYEGHHALMESNTTRSDTSA